MKLAELIAKVESLRPSEYDKDELTQWVNEIEFQAVDTVFNKAMGVNMEFKKYNYELNAETELLIPDQFNGVYLTYLFTKIDYFNAETDRYSLDSTMHEAEWTAFANWFRRHFRPKRRLHAPWYATPVMPGDVLNITREELRKAIDDVIGAEY